MSLSLKFFWQICGRTFSIYLVLLIFSPTILLTYAQPVPVQNSGLPSPASNSPPLTVNTSKTFRVAVFGDVDSNPGLTRQLDLMNKYHVQTLLLAGDFEYTDGKAVLDDLSKHGFNKNNSDIVVGNHDSGSNVNSWLGTNRTFGKHDFAQRKLSVFNIDANTKFGCSSPQFLIIKSNIEQSQAQYKFALVHQPFVTVKSTHSDNGQFNCYNPMFKANNASAVLQAHNHNYQKEIASNILYGVYGTGTHDEGSNLYPCDSKTDQNGVPALCITGENGITILDLQIGNASSRHIDGWFINNAEKVVDKFTLDN
ncbi:MAG TPA: metallophosphoesterase [Nitrososphaeraceae archaeon]